MKPSEKAVHSKIDGKEVIDKLGRKLLLRKPNVLDLYDLMSTLGDDSKNAICQGMAMHVLYVAKINENIFDIPHTYAEFRAALKRLDSAGIEAIAEAIREDDPISTEQEAVKEIKK